MNLACRLVREGAGIVAAPLAHGARRTQLKRRDGNDVRASCAMPYNFRMIALREQQIPV